MIAKTVFSHLLAMMLIFLPSTRLVVVQHDDYVIKANISLEKSKVETQNDVIYHYFLRGRIMESQGDFTGYLLNGEFQKVLVTNTMVEKGAFVNGLKEGEWKSWYDTGILSAVENWQQGKQNGLYEHFDPAGNSMERGQFKDGVKDGKVQKFLDGELFETIAYKKGNEIFKTQAKTTSKAYGGSNKKTNKQPIIPESETSDVEIPKQKTMAIYYTDKSSSTPLADVSVIITNQATGERTRKITNAAGEIKFQGGQYSYSLETNHEGFERHATSVTLVADEQYVWIELEKMLECAPIKYELIDEEGRPVTSKTELQIVNLHNGEKQSLFTDSGKLESCFKCGGQYRLQLFNKDYEYKTADLAINPNCDMTSSDNQQLVLAKLKVSPKKKVPQTPTRSNVITATPTSPELTYPERRVERPVTSSPPRRSSEVSSGTTSPLVSAQEKYYVVVGTFSSQLNAEGRLAKIQKAGYQQGAVLKDPSSDLWSVYADQFSDYAMAKSLERKIKKKGGFKVFVKIVK